MTTTAPLGPGKIDGRSGQRRPAWLAMVALGATLLAVVLGLAIGQAAATAPPVRQPSASLDMSQVDRFVQQELEASSLPGAALAITRGDQVLHVRGYGHDATGAAITGTSLFRIASLSKSITAMAVMQLVDAGRLSLDHTVASYLPEFHPADTRAADITVSQVLNQTSGLADRAFNELDDPQPHTLTEAVSRLNTATLVADPGTQWNYHNPNYEVAARLVEVASGRSFDNYLREQVFLPAGMSASSTTYTDNAPVAGLTDGHVMAYGQAVAIGLPDKFGAGAGDVVSTASDMAKWLIVNTNRGRSANGRRLVSENALSQMHTASTRVGYGYGWSENRAPGSPTRVGHTGNLLTYSSFQTILPETGYGVVLLFNSGSARTIDQTAIFDGVLGMVAGTSSPRGGLQISATTLDLLLGVLTIAVFIAGTLGVLRSRKWVTRVSRPRKLGRTRTVLRLLPYAGVIGFVAAFPAIAGNAFGGRAVSWSSAAYAWPAAVILVVAVLIATLATLGARVWHLARTRRATTVG
jgi:CubicO group peptidase (beta-lactamase class C family)